MKAGAYAGFPLHSCRIRPQNRAGAGFRRSRRWRLPCSPAAWWRSPSAPAKSNSEKLEAVEEKIGAVEEREGVLTSDIAAMGDEISALEGQVSALRTQEAAAEEELAAKEAELGQAEDELNEALKRLDTLRGRLKRALVNLRERLVAIYTYGATSDLTAVILSSEDYGDMVARTEYFDAINESDSGAGRAGAQPARRSEEAGAGAEDREADDRKGARRRSPPRSSGWKRPARRWSRARGRCSRPGPSAARR